MVITVQGLGKFDAKLMARDAAYLDLSEEKREQYAVSLDLTSRFTDSYLWVLGAYEVIRAMDQRCRADPKLVEDSAHLRAAKHFFERVRIPLAKFESARRFSETDSTIAYPSISPDHGIAWQVADDVFISRMELSECFIELLRKL